MRRALPLVLLTACSAAAPATRPVPARGDPLAPAIDRLAADALARTPVAGLSIAVARRGQLVLARGYGLADAEARTPVTAETVFRIGSITKQFTAVAILQLAAAGRLSLDDDLARHLPDYPARGKAITLRELLAHTSGIHDYEHGAWLGEHMAEHRPRAELVASFASVPLDFDPGTRWAYSNSGYYLLGLIVERVSGQPYADYVRDRVLAPAGIAGIRHCPDEQDYPHAARGYDLTGGARVPARPIAMEHAYAAGGLCATAPALLAWSKALAGGRIVDPAAWRAMTTPVTLADGTRHGYGLGLFLAELEGHRVIFHGGGVNGFVSTLAYYPDDELHVAVLANTHGDVADDLGDAVARAALDLPLPDRGDRPLDPAELAAVAGRYEATAIGVTLIVEAKDGQLFARKEGGAPRQLMRQRDGGYAVADRNARLVFVREGGRVIGFKYVQAGMMFEGRRIP